MLMHFLDFLFPPRTDTSAVRSLTKDAVCARLALQEIATTVPHTTGLLPFDDSSVAALIHEAKYHENQKAFELLAQVLAEYVQEAEEDLRHACFVTIPLGKKRLRERGYNQVTEVAKRTHTRLGIAVSEKLLFRTRETKSQVALTKKERRENMRGAFGAAHVLDPALLYILIDDVITTGSTMQSAIDALRASGAKKILPIALAYAAAEKC